MKDLADFKFKTPLFHNYTNVKQKGLKIWYGDISQHSFDKAEVGEL